jgi:hypothetical protein
LTSATTNAQGQFDDGSENGNYYVRIASADLALGGIIQYFTAQKDGNSVDNFDADENINHDAIARNISTIRTPVFNINEGTEPTSEIDETFSLDSSSNLTADFGLVRPVTLGNLVWRDRNKNGIQDENEEGISGVAIKATWFGPDGVLGGSDDFEFTTTSSSNGEWQVTGPAGRYRIEFLAPNGYTVTIPDVGIDSGDSDQNGISESLNAGDSNFSFDFVYTPEDSEKESDSEKVTLFRNPFEYRFFIRCKSDWVIFHCNCCWRNTLGACSQEASYRFSPVIFDDVFQFAGSLLYPIILIGYKNDLLLLELQC